MKRQLSNTSLSPNRIQINKPIRTNKNKVKKATKFNEKTFKE
jgi:hypothetical protein